MARSIGQPDPDLSITFPDRVGPNPAGGRTTQGLPGFQIELGIVPGAENTAILHGTERQGGIGVGTPIVEGEQLPLVTYQGDSTLSHHVGPPLSFLDLLRVRNLFEIFLTHADT